jgi:hypothetical protein
MSTRFTREPSVATTREGRVAYVPIPRAPVEVACAFPEERL